MDFRVNLGHFGSEIWDFGVRNLGFFMVDRGWMRPVGFGLNLGHFGVEIRGFWVRNLGFFCGGRRLVAACGF